jgi:hypothetical protein
MPVITISLLASFAAAVSDVLVAACELVLVVVVGGAEGLAGWLCAIAAVDTDASAIETTRQGMRDFCEIMMFPSDHRAFNIVHFAALA